jgi:nucleoside-diphosphate-sugar epimerase
MEGPVKVLVMGGTQFNGYALTLELVRQGHEVTVLNRGRTEAVLPKSVQRLVCDRTDDAQMRQVLGNLEFDCIHDISAYRPEDVELMIDLFQGRTGHYIFASSTVIYAATNLLPITEDFPVERGPIQNEYAINKLLCEDLLIRAHREHGFPASIAAFSMVFGPRNILPDREQRMYARLLKGRPVLMPGDGTTLGQVGHVDDEARALCAMMQKPATFGRRYNLTGADTYTDEGYIDTFAETVGKPAEKVSIPAELMDQIWAGQIEITGKPIQAKVDTRTTHRDPREVQLFLFQRILQRIGPHLHHWSQPVYFSIDRLKEDTGWKPQISFRSAVEQTYEWFCAEGLDESLEFDFSFEDELLARIGA